MVGLVVALRGGGGERLGGGGAARAGADVSGDGAARGAAGRAGGDEWFAVAKCGDEGGAVARLRERRLTWTRQPAALVNGCAGCTMPLPASRSPTKASIALIKASRQAHMCR